MIVQLLDQKMRSRLMTIGTSKRYISPEIVSWVNEKVIQEHIIFKIVNPRKRKLGDYRFYIKKKQHQITINNDLNEELFFLTFIHELAHKKAFDEYGRRIRPHGAEWKHCFRTLLMEGIKVTTNSKVIETLNNSVISPRACIHIKDESYLGLTVADLQLNDSFKLNNSKKIYILKGKRRTRYSCIAKKNNAQYSVSSDAQVTKCN
ncbi:MAG: SprT protein [Saprospiraceae bacterium]|jgi:SprT protein